MWNWMNITFRIYLSPNRTPSCFENLYQEMLEKLIVYETQANLWIAPLFFPNFTARRRSGVDTFPTRYRKADFLYFNSSKPTTIMQNLGPEHDDSFDFLFKIILIGDSNVGKTCVVQNFKSGIFAERQQNTIGVDFTVRTVDIEGKKVKVRHWVCTQCINHGRQKHALCWTSLDISVKAAVNTWNCSELWSIMLNLMVNYNN